MTGSSFRFPREYSYPPFFTLQPTSTSLSAQFQKWASLILAYTRHNHIFRLSLIDASSTPLFQNPRLNKHLTLHDIREVIAYMVKDGRAEWIGTEKGEAWIWWRNPEEWAGVISDWVEETAQKNSVLTVYELMEGEATVSQEFHGMDPDLMQKALAILVKRGKAQVFGQEDGQGVKFF